MGRVGRQEVQFHAQLRTLKSWLKYLGMMVTRIVDYDVNYGLRVVVFLNLFQQLPSGFSIDLFALDEGELEGFEIKRALKIDPPATRSGFNRRLLILRKRSVLKSLGRRLSAIISDVNQ